MIFPLFYFGPVSYYAQLSRQEDVSFEIFENFRKQTYRNRCYIQGANGKLRLAIPIEHDGCRLMKDIKMSDEANWRKEHLKSFISAYKSSPYFEFYEDDLTPLFEKKEKFLVDFNLATFDFVKAKLKFETAYKLTAEYIERPKVADLRTAFNSKQEPDSELFPVYMQVFDDKFGFMPDLSVLDLLFNLGPAAATYLNNLAE